MLCLEFGGASREVKRNARKVARVSKDVENLRDGEIIEERGKEKGSECGEKEVKSDEEGGKDINYETVMTYVP